MAVHLTKTVESKDHNFEISFPESWDVFDRVPFIFARFPIGDPSTAEASISIHRNAELYRGIDLKKYVGRNIRSLTNQFNVKVIRSGAFDLNGIHSVEFTYLDTENSNSPDRRRVSHCFFMIGTRGYGINITLIQRSFRKHARAVNAILKSVTKKRVKR